MEGGTGGQGDVTAWLGSNGRRRVSVTPSRDSSVIEFSVTWTIPTNAAIIANLCPDAYIDTT